MGGRVEHTSDREKRSAFIDGNSFVHSDSRTLKGLFLLIIFTEHYGSGRGHGTRPLSSGGDGSNGHSEGTSNGELGRLGPAPVWSSEP